MIGAGFVLAVIWQFPDILAKGVVKRIEHTYNARLEELKGRIRANESSVNTAVEYLTQARSELRSKVSRL